MADKVKILIVEDELITAENIRQILERNGYDVVGVAADGRDAVRISSEAKPDLILMDVLLQGDMDGIEAAGAIHDLLDIPIIYITSLSDKSTLDRAKNTSPYGYLNKPLNVRDLCATVDMALYKYSIERQLKDREDFLQSILRTAPVGIGIVTNRIIGWTNKKLQDMTGYTEEELFGRSARMIYSDDDEYERVGFEQYQQILKTGSSTLETRWKRRDDKIVEILLGATPLKSSDLAGGITFTALDMTERKNTLRALIESEEKYRNLFTHASDGICIVQDGMLTLANKQMEIITGRSAEMTMSMPFNELIDPEEIEKVLKKQEFFRQSRMETQRYETRLIHREGHRIEVEFRISKTTFNGRDASMVIVSDITERRRAQELLIQSEKMMTVGSLAAGMAHEINNPLGIILQAVQAIEAKLSTEYAKNVESADTLGLDLGVVKNYLDASGVADYLEGVREAAVRASKIVSNMLQFSRRSESRMSPVDLNTLIDNTLEMASSDYDLKKRYDFRKISVTRNLAPNLPPVMCIETEIEQVVLNLLKNAAQAMININDTDFKPTIRIDTNVENGSAIIRLTDNGQGMGREVLRHIFEPFYTTKKAGLGTGLGLSVSYFIITTNHGGSITADSEPGRGSTFTIVLPLAKEEQ